MQSYALDISTKPAPEDIEFLEERLDAFNSAATGFANGEWLSIFARDDDGGIIAGISGALWGDCLEVRQFWVEEKRRGQGLGTGLFAAAEREARRRGCEQIVLATFSFQAPAFYARLGFEQVAKISEYPRGHAHLILRKQFDRHPAQT